MGETDLKKRTKSFEAAGLKILDELPNNRKGWIVGDQLGRSGTGVGANYGAACRARSSAEFIAKLGVVIEEADESAYWLELAMEDGLLDETAATPLWKEADELTAIMRASRKTAEKNKDRKE